MREPLIFGLWKVEKELVGNRYLNSLEDIKKGIEKLKLIIEKAEAMIK